MLFFKTVALASCVSSALATVFITAPIGTTTFKAGEKAAIRWNDSKDAPSLAEFGKANVGIWAGSQGQQTELQSIAKDVDVSKINTVEFFVDPSIGPDSKDYFIRIDSTTAKNPNDPKNQAQAFSAKFQLTGMTGKFTAAVEAQINGSPVAAAAPGINADTSSSSSRIVTTTPSRSISAADVSRTVTPESNAASSSSTGGFLGVLCVFAVGAMLL